MINVCNGKGNALECRSYSEIKLFEYVIKVLYERIEVKIRNKINVDEMQFEFSRVKANSEDILIVRRVEEEERYLQKKVVGRHLDILHILIYISQMSFVTYIKHSA